MRCNDVNEVFAQISAYFSGEKIGKFFIVNTENYDTHNRILQRLQTDNGRKIIHIYQNLLPNGLPDVDTAVMKAVDDNRYIIVGLSQALMLRDDKELENKLAEILQQPIRGYGVVLLDHCEQILKKFINRDVRVADRVLLVVGETSSLPQIKLAKSETECIDVTPFFSFGKFLEYMERITDTQINQRPDITIISKISSNAFAMAVYSVQKAEGVYESLQKKDPNFTYLTRKSYGSESQWQWLSKNLSSVKGFADFVCDNFGSTTNLSVNISNAANSSDENKKWLLWLALKIFGEKNNKYLTLVLSNCNDYKEFTKCVYLNLADVKSDDANFNQMYDERKSLLNQMPENRSLIKDYCNKLGKHQRNSIFYLTDNSDTEKTEFMKCLNIYKYNDEELNRAVSKMSKNLSLYIKSFVFSNDNLKLAENDSEFVSKLTLYFTNYKLQKLKNSIDAGFLDTVNQYAISRPYNKLQPRSSIISHIDRTGTSLFFFDALGVEYLAFIMAKCEEYSLVAEIFVGHCELPSITEKNKEFISYFDNCFKIDKLDNIKHQNQQYDYQKCKYPIHLFAELEVIDEELRKIQAKIFNEEIAGAVIVSDHGASRLAVLYDNELDTTIKMDEPGKHSGRCCPASEDPKLPFAAYENGFSVLANYERFKGGRRADVEVHGGASLEEMLVPIIKLTNKLTNIEIYFINSTIILKPKVVPELMIYANIPIQNPRLCIENKFYDGELAEDNKHARFLLPQIKRKGNYQAVVYFGNKKMSKSLEFKVERLTKEVDLF